MRVTLTLIGAGFSLLVFLTSSRVRPLLVFASPVSANEQTANLGKRYVAFLRRGSGEVFPDRAPAAIASRQAEEDQIAEQLKQISPSQLTSQVARITYAVLKQNLESRIGIRACRHELWDLSHTQGWQAELAGLAASQPVMTAASRQKALEQWGSFPHFIDSEVTNLRHGLASGYSAPRTIVDRVLRQVDGILANPKLLDSPAARSSDRDFAMRFRKLVASDLVPALRRFREFLANDYAPHARTSLGISSLPNGSACYAGYLRRYSSLQTTPEAVFRKGEAVVTETTAEIQRLGEKLFATTDLSEIIRRSRAAPENRFASRQELLEYSRQVLDRARAKSQALFERLPSQAVVITPVAAYLQNSGVSSHYQAENDFSKAAVFWIELDGWKDETRGAAEITVVHETFPGHHVQSVMSHALAPRSALAGLAPNAAYIEGWANYAEQLAEESGIDNDAYERIQRRVLYGRSLVLDPGINAFGWSREQAEKYVMQAGMSKQAADDIIDRVVVEPGQLTAYELGGLEIRRLREDERRRLGLKFDLKKFHERILENGPLPLEVLGQMVISGKLLQRRPVVALCA